MKKLLLFILPVFICTSPLFSQEEVAREPVASVSAGLGVLTFNGSIGKGKDVSKFTYIRGGYGLNVERRFMKDWVGASLNIVSGKLAMGERSTDTAHNKNFESSLMQFGLNITGYLQNNNGLPLIPYVTTGFAFASLSAKTDIKYKGDSLYYYWTDGSVRNLPQIPANEFIAKHVNRDYIYESSLKGAATSAMSIPVGIGFKMQIGPKFEANLGTTYHFTFSKNIDGVNGSKTDKYLYSYFTLTYNITQKTKEEKEKEKKSTNVDFAKIDKLDMDGDGIPDNIDECPGTPKGVKVDSRGCPLDSDGDGVPDYLDKEKDTKRGAIVDAEGRTITDAMILEKAQHDSIASTRTNIFMNDPSLSSLKKMDTEIKKKAGTTGNAKSKVPAQFQPADTNNDGIISSTEITAVIDGFFDGSNNYTVEKIHALIDYFFEQ
ncbi:MAG TPA: thrombospondin type 3 repeat-containing protein [Bacteroidia bacterium]